MATITKGQLKRLQVLYSQLARHTLDAGPSREARLTWAAQLLGHAVASFSNLTPDDARVLIDSAQGVLGVRAATTPRKRLSRDEAHRAGTDGRRDEAEYSTTPQLASADDLATIENYYGRLGWNRAQFDGWLRSRYSPLKHKAKPAIRTMADANRVRWALKGMLQAAGKWEESARA